MPREVDVWFHPTTLTTHLSEKCARQGGRPAKQGRQELLLDTVWDGLWCQQCSQPGAIKRRLEAEA